MKKILFSVVLLSFSLGVNAAPGDYIDRYSTLNYEVFASPVLGIDGYSYVTLDNGNLWGFDTSGSYLIQDHVTNIYDPGFDSPVVGIDNTLYVWGENSNGTPTFYAIDLDNKSEKWKITRQYTGSEPAIDMNQVIYVTVNDSLLILDSDTGNITKEVEVSGVALGDVAIDTEVIYARTKVVATGDTGIIAFRNDGSIKWNVIVSNETPSILNEIAIASDGNIIVVFDDVIYSLSPVDGQVNWQYTVDGRINGSPVIDEYDNVFVGTNAGKVYSINNQGEANWSTPFDLPDGITTSSTPALSASGNIYVAGNEVLAHIYAINTQTKNEEWRTPDSSLNDRMGAFSISSPLVLDSGRIVIGHGYGGDNMSFIRLFESDPGGLLSPLNSWPMFRGNQQHTAMRNTGIYEKEVLLDNDDDSSSAQGGWLIIHGDITVIVPLPGGQWEETTDGSNYEGDSFHIASSESESLTFSWKFTAASTGNHSIEANIPVRADNTIAAVYTVLDSSGSEVCGPVTIDQEVNAGTWVEITECMLVIDQEYKLKLENGDGIIGRKLIADAIRINRK